ncbi:MAG: hypothetical protein JXD23_03670, partial [Spirochaetales bacterium]|nr:hypothetical protein [Spirochaetales bacterium]
FSFARTAMKNGHIISVRLDGFTRVKSALPGVSANVSRQFGLNLLNGIVETHGRASLRFNPK